MLLWGWALMIALAVVQYGIERVTDWLAGAEDGT